MVIYSSGYFYIISSQLYYIQGDMKMVGSIFNSMYIHRRIAPKKIDPINSKRKWNRVRFQEMDRTTVTTSAQLHKRNRSCP